jgi:hypothetical protein
MYILWQRKQYCISLSEGAVGGEREKENGREWKMLKQYIYIWIQ